MAHYLVTVVHKASGKRSEVPIEARNRAAAFELADQNPEIMAGAVRDMPDGWGEQQPKTDNPDPAVAALMESNRRLRQILILLVVVLVAIPILFGIIFTIAAAT
ncbi:MAG: hypothetical protein NXI14_02005 [bacterium]|nr:hypothetical protein [bacterium]